MRFLILLLTGCSVLTTTTLAFTVLPTSPTASVHHYHHAPALHHNNELVLIQPSSSSQLLSTTTLNSNRNDDFEFDDVFEGANDFADNSDAILTNVFSGKLGTRGEVFVLAQAALLVAIVFGEIPIIGEAVDLLFGPILLISGIAVSLSAVFNLGRNLSPWPTVAESSDGLVTTGLYAQVRHPIYAGLLAACAGYSVMSDSATRMLLTAALIYVLEIKSDFEENELKREFPLEYGEYLKDVPTKFVPKVVLDLLPWTKDKYDLL